MPPADTVADSAPAVTLATIQDAAGLLDGVIIQTPCLPAPRLSALTGANVWVKYENMQAVGSFKERGAFIKLASLTAAERDGGVAAMSAGNHAQAVAYHATRLGIRATIVMPERTPMVKVSATEAHGARVVLAGETIAESAIHCAELVARDGLTLIHPYDDNDIIRGQGTVGLEMMAAAPDLDMIVVPIGGGGLIAGTAIAAQGIKPGVRMIGVEAALYPSATAALERRDGQCGGSTIAEGIAVKTVGTRTLPIIDERVERIVLVDEPHLERAVNAYITLQKTMAEGAGAAGLAAMLADPSFFAGQNVGLVLCGGNIDPRILASIMVRELARQGRIISLEANYADEPGLLARLTTAIGAAGGNILDVSHNRLDLTHLARETSIRLVIETRDDSHTARVVAAVQATGLAARLTGHVDGGF
ncbi:threonine ammonia-lyase [Acuticoccus sp. MNP-M23]|uniref:threonine ammonia-lyase n=1 Tax=Acuticoccus sp. MNP-M23 TaxID=3072793 RepID=UPI002815A355|nr:threonine ammonia-lyase [Acuticoccus sp. MNP-M23]WMS42472.1 threonine ammonia-lyase [Acuticoccus sp. MNP-M23]